MDKELYQGYENDFILPMTSVNSGLTFEIGQDLLCLTTQIVNVVFIGNPEQPQDYVLVDAGMPHAAEMIFDAVEERFGKGSKPKAIILTHGHFDHVGSIIELVESWQIPVYAHTLELPYLTGKSDYPEPDPTVDGGLVPKLSPLFPNHAINLGKAIHPLPANGQVPELPEWRWIHTPGHTPGHISLFRESDRSLIVGDAFVTVKQEALYKVMMQEREISGPPKYYTVDWTQAEASVQRLKALRPRVAITGHGVPIADEELHAGLSQLADQFDRLAIPKRGKYLH